LRDTKIGGFQGISPKQAEFTEFGGYIGVGMPLPPNSNSVKLRGELNSLRPELLYWHYVQPSQEHKRQE
jgi:hypothetical protein